MADAKGCRSRLNPHFPLLLFGRAEVFLTHTAEGTHPVSREVFKGGAGGDAVVGVAFGRVVLIVADVANVLFHSVVILRFNKTESAVWRDDLSTAAG